MSNALRPSEKKAQPVEERFALPISGRPETVGIQNGDVGALPLSPDDPNFTAVGCRHC